MLYLTAGNIQVKCDNSHFSNCWQLYDFAVMTSPSRHTDIVSQIASKLWDRIKLIKRSLWILSPKAARSSQTGSPLTFNLMRNIFTLTFWKRVSDPIQHSGVRHWAIYLSVLPIWTWRAKCVHATPTFYLLSEFRLLLQSFILFSLVFFLNWNKYRMETGINLYGGSMFSRYILSSLCSTPTSHRSPSHTVAVSFHTWSHSLIAQQVILTMWVGFKTSKLSLPGHPPQPSPFPNT